MLSPLSHRPVQEGVTCRERGDAAAACEQVRPLPRLQPWRGSYVPGAISWSIALASVVGVIFLPSQWVWVCIVGFVYFLARLFAYLIFYVVGEVRCQLWSEVDWTEGEERPGPRGVAPHDVYHVVVVPAFREPAEILRHTLEALAAQHRATERVIVVLGMEEAEDGGLPKGRRLATEFSSRFLRIIATEHPRSMGGEVAGKASNQTWAARAGLRELRGVGADSATATITSCDADSALHPSYLAAVARSFAQSPDPHGTFWQAPVLFDTNIWEVPAVVRLSTWFAHGIQTAELAMPFYEPLPMSTYTLSLHTAEQCGWWDPLVISEDWHEYLNCLFARGGRLRLQPVFLPVTGAATDGATPLAAIVNRFHQLVRHAWGAEDVGFLLTALAARGALHRRRGVWRLVQVTQDHVLRVSTWFFATSGYLLTSHGWAQVAMADTLTHPPEHLPDVARLFSLGTIALFGMIFVDLRRCPPPPGPRRWLMPLEIAFLWLALPFVGFVFGMLPALYAQTKLMLGQTIAYRTTPRRAPQRAA